MTNARLFEEVNAFHRSQEIGQWVEEGSTLSRVVHIAYPTSVCYVVDKLVGNSWEDTGNTFYEKTLAVANAQKLAVQHQVPFRVRELVVGE